MEKEGRRQLTMPFCGLEPRLDWRVDRTRQAPGPKLPGKDGDEFGKFGVHKEWKNRTSKLNLNIPNMKRTNGIFTLKLTEMNKQMPMME